MVVEFRFKILRMAERAHIDDVEGSREERVRWPVLILVFGTLCGASVMATYLEFQTRSAHLAMSNLPLVVLIPFVVWLTVNVLLKRLVPRFSLKSGEMRLLFSTLWVGGSFAGYNWATQWVGTMVAPRYYASPENRWVELIFDYLPWWMYPTHLPGVVEDFYLGASGAPPWLAWMGPTLWATAAGLSMMTIGLGITAIFQRHWSEHERLTYPLAEVPIALTDGFDRKRGWPPFLTHRLFWIGFAVAAFPILWNIIEYFVTGFPRITLFDAYYGPTGPRGTLISRYLREFSYRLLPTVMGFTFLCDVRILFSIWSMYLMGLVIQYAMTRVGFSIGLAGQEAKPPEIVGLFVHGVMVGLVVWSIWTARGHLRRVWDQVWRGEQGHTVLLSPRMAVLAIVGGGLFMTFWLHAAGYALWLAATWITLFWVGLFAVMKFLSASGFAYLFPNWGTTIPMIWTGTIGLSESSLVASRIVNWRLLAGWRLPPALPHVERLIGGRGKVAGMIVIATLTGLFVGAWYTIGLCYSEGGATFSTWSLVGAPRGMYNGIAKVVAETSDRTVPDPEKISIWLIGIGASGLITLLQARVTWWPWHPLGLLLMFDGYVRIYVLDIAIVWLAKVIILRLGGISLYRRAKPFCYGLIVGFTFAITCACAVDLIWFRTGGHYVHGY